MNDESHAGKTSIPELSFGPDGSGEAKLRREVRRGWLALAEDEGTYSVGLETRARLLCGWFSHEHKSRYGGNGGNGSVLAYDEDLDTANSEMYGELLSKLAHSIFEMRGTSCPMVASGLVANLAALSLDPPKNLPRAIFMERIIDDLISTVVINITFDSLKRDRDGDLSLGELKVPQWFIDEVQGKNQAVVNQMANSCQQDV
ncbi:MAG: hypothetical protein ABIH35_01195 [Patescibacteria group bacterium]